MVSVVITFMSLVIAVVGALAGDATAQNKLRHPVVESAQFEPTANARLGTAFSGPRQSQTIELKDADWVDARNGRPGNCRPGQGDCYPGNGASPPAFHGPGRTPPQTPPYGYPPQAPPYSYPPQQFESRSDTLLGVVGIIGVLAILIGGGIGGFAGYSSEKEKERLELEAKAAKEAAFRARAIKLNSLEKRAVV